MDLSSLRVEAAWSRVMPSGMLMVTDSAFTVFEAELDFAVATLAGSAASVGAALWVDGRLCAPAIRLHASTNHPRRLIFSPEASLHQALYGEERGPGAGRPVGTLPD